MAGGLRLGGVVMAAADRARHLGFWPRSVCRIALGMGLIGLIACAPEPFVRTEVSRQRSIADLIDAALAATPPQEQGSFRDSDLVAVQQLDPSLQLDVRYATSNNFVGVAVYDTPQVFLQRPAAEALVRVHRALALQGFGLRLFDGYRPWYVTRVFWDVTPEAQREFVADPAQGSRHNRGCAVDLTLFDLATGQAVDMPSDYDDFSERAYPDYSGASAIQKRHRDLLRAAMAAEGFTVYPSEWWHFDHRDWPHYRIGNTRFESLLGLEGRASHR